jgi:secondary thiamine-phosphate synthase enzyme
MKQEFYSLQINTNGQKLYEFTDQTIQWISENHFINGIINLSILHTSASLIVQENADPDVQTDLLNYFDKLAPMDNKLYVHTTEGKDDMPAHIKSALTNNQISLSIKDSKLLLGTWQGLYLFEHRLETQNRTIIHHFIGD